mmetsp:Transcript_26905/g.30074  ORF Transcript_26905/g.30074 Transcript_26905/m.30074 type:complete len:130 (+) Transcript_26905:508-897(+)
MHVSFSTPRQLLQQQSSVHGEALYVMPTMKNLRLREKSKVFGEDLCVLRSIRNMWRLEKSKVRGEVTRVSRFIRNMWRRRKFKVCGGGIQIGVTTQDTLQQERSKLLLEASITSMRTSAIRQQLRFKQL